MYFSNPFSTYIFTIFRLPFQAQIRALERAKSTGQFESPEEVLEANGLNFEVGTAEDAAAAAQE